MKTIMLIVVVVASILVFQPRRTVFVVAMMGQSNAVGHAAIPADADLKTDPRVMVYGRDGKIVPAREPLDGCRGGWGVALGRMIVGRDENSMVMLIPSAVNGSSIEEWTRDGGYLPPTLDRIDAAMREASRFGDAKLLVVWDQGESDMMSPERAKAWPSRFGRIVDAVNKRWSGVSFSWSVTARPQAEPATRLLWWKEVQSAQRGMVVSNGRAVDLTDLPIESDGVHRTWSAQQTAAERFYGALIGPRP